MISKRYQYFSKLQLDEILQNLLDIHTVKVFSITIEPRYVVAELSEDIAIEYSVDTPLDQIRRKPLEVYDYKGEFTQDVLFAIMGELKKDNLLASYMVISPGSFMKKTPHWACGSFDTIADTRFMGMIVMEDVRLDDSSFIIVGCTGVDPRMYTIVKSYKGVENE